MPEHKKLISDVVDDLVDIWHTAPVDNLPSLEQFLGFSEREYATWVSHPDDVGGREQYLRWLHSQLTLRADVAAQLGVDQGEDLAGVLKEKLGAMAAAVTQPPRYPRRGW